MLAAAQVPGGHAILGTLWSVADPSEVQETPGHSTISQ